MELRHAFLVAAVSPDSDWIDDTDHEVMIIELDPLADGLPAPDQVHIKVYIAIAIDADEAVAMVSTHLSAANLAEREIVVLEASESRLASELRPAPSERKEAVANPLEDVFLANDFTANRERVLHFITEVHTRAPQHRPRRAPRRFAGRRRRSA